MGGSIPEQYETAIALRPEGGHGALVYMTAASADERERIAGSGGLLLAARVNIMAQPLVPWRTLPFEEIALHRQDRRRSF